MEDASFFDYFDFLSFDRGCGSLTAILAFLRQKGTSSDGDAPFPLYKTLYRSEGRLIPGTHINAAGISGSRARKRAEPSLKSRDVLRRGRNLRLWKKKRYKRCSPITAILISRGILGWWTIPIPCTGSGPTGGGSGRTWPAAMNR
jgi:hypothetical protein